MTTCISSYVGRTKGGLAVQRVLFLEHLWVLRPHRTLTRSKSFVTRLTTIPTKHGRREYTLAGAHRASRELSCSMY